MWDSVKFSVKWVSDLSIFRTAVHGLEFELYNAISLANVAIETGWMVFRRCAVWMLNNKGESTAPCGTPMYRDFGVALALITLKKAFLFSKNDNIILYILGGVLCLWSSYSSAGWETNRKAFVQSIDTMHVVFSFHNASCMSSVSVILFNCVRVAFYCLKSAWKRGITSALSACNCKWWRITFPMCFPICSTLPYNHKSWEFFFRFIS